MILVAEIRSAWHLSGIDMPHPAQKRSFIENNDALVDPNRRFQGLPFHLAYFLCRPF
ncbi:hypothetical protein ACPOL_2333 [Acidisarcina polymorpha]|uniref:Uncharacterized protein n=1 Tax=Acidisarcina polymorpha TaxID=2211140 RepID=A0A2Z5FYW3_9BACT|nr:hypothetical protein ACPOL_2333 [Acidisarcina polymorpha]